MPQLTRCYEVTLPCGSIEQTGVAAGTPVPSCEAMSGPVSPLAAAGPSSSSPCASVSPTLGICGSDAARPAPDAHQHTPQKAAHPGLHPPAGSPSEPHSPEFRAPAGSPLLRSGGGGRGEGGEACTPQLLSRPSGGAPEPSPQSDALWAFLRSAEGQVAALEARLAAAEADFATLLAFFGQKVPAAEALRTAQPAAFLSLVVKIVDGISTARAQREQVDACASGSCDA